MKKILCILLAVMLLSFTGCATKTLHCDSCGVEVKVSQDSNMEEDWIILCGDCEKEVDLDLD